MNEALLNIKFLGEQVAFGVVHEYSYLFAFIFALAYVCGTIFSIKQLKKNEFITSFIYAGSAICALFSGDYISLFLCLEIMALASTFLLLSNGEVKSAINYAIIHFLSGVILLAGLLFKYHTIGDLSLAPLNLNFTEDILILIAILINVAAPPLSAWVPQSYPKASHAGSIFLSTFTTKTAIFCLILLAGGIKILAPLGIIMIIYGFVYALLSNNLRSILSYSIVNQLGFMLVAIAFGNSQGAAIQAFAHISYKTLLFAWVAALFIITKKETLTELEGKLKRGTFMFYTLIIGVASISALPLTFGFISKSLVTNGLPDLYYWALTILSAGTLVYLGARVPYYLYYAAGRKLPIKTDIAIHQKIIMGLLCLVLVGLGVYPYLLESLLSEDLDFKLKFIKVLKQVIVASFGIFIFYVLRKSLKPKQRNLIDMDWFYNTLGKVNVLFIERILLLVASIFNILGKYIRFNLEYLFNRLFVGNGLFSRTWLLSTTITILLLIFLLIYGRTL